MSDQGAKLSRSILPIPSQSHIGLTTYDAKDPNTKFPPIEPLRPPKGAPEVQTEDCTWICSHPTLSEKLQAQIATETKGPNLVKPMNGLSSPWFRLGSVFIIVLSISPLFAQQKGQWVPGGFGLNAGVIPDPGITYANLALNYSADRLNDSNGNRILTNVTGTYSFWVDENIFYYVPKHKFLGGYFMPYVAVNYANGEVVAALNGTNLGTSAGGSGLADTFVEPLQMGWHLNRADFTVGYSFLAPTGRYTAGASDNVGSGYWGNNITSGTTFYITKNKGTSANLATNWEIHGQKTVASAVQGQLSKITPGQAFTMEWGFGQVLPLKKDMSMLAQLGLVGYDQWQVSANGGNYLVAGVPVPASLVPYYSVHGIGFQSNFILPGKNLALFFKYYDEYRAKATTQGRTIVFGGSWTFRIPKPAAHNIETRQDPEPR
jgi:hypothetical protein